MATYTPDFSKRTKATQHYAGVNAGFYCDFRHVNGAAETVQICPAGSSVILTSINVAPGSGNVVMTCGNDEVAQFTIARDYKQGFYAYAPIFLTIPDATADVTVYFTVPAKGQAASQ